MNVGSLIVVLIAIYNTNRRGFMKYTHNRFASVVLMVLFTVVSLFACAAITKKGTQCKRPAQEGSVYCWQHERMYGNSQPSQEPTTPQTNTTTPNSKSNVGTESTQPVLVQCQATTKKGTRCKRMTKSSNGFCWQHSGN